MAQTAAHNKHIAAQERLYVAFELGWTKWKLGFCSRLDEKAWVTTIDARDIGAMKRTIAKARTRFKVSATCPVASCYEAGRDGFWLDRLLKQMSVENVVVDSGSIKVDRRARRAKTDRLDAEDLVTMLVRYVSGEPKVWHVVRVPSPEQEDARHLQREIRSLKKEQTRIVNRVRGLLASQGVSVKMGRRGLLVPLEALRTWDGSPLPPGLTLRVGQELSRHVVVHEQMLALEAQRHRGIQEEGSANAAMSQRLMELKAIGETTAETLTPAAEHAGTLVPEAVRIGRPANAKDRDRRAGAEAPDRSLALCRVRRPPATGSAEGPGRLKRSNPTRS
ncbi:MAG: transposase [Holophagales bacterium]|nr:transposase [Holophagales bacterium]